MRMQRYVLSAVGFCVVVATATVASANPHGTVDPTPFDFGNRHVGVSPSPTHVFTVTNAPAGGGNDDYTATAIVESGTGCGEVSASPTSFTIVGAGTQNITVTYAPTTRGAVDCTFTLTDNDDGTDLFRAQGQGTSPDMVVTSSLDFGDVAVPSGSNTLSITIQNTVTGNENLNWSVAINPASTEFSTTGTVSGTGLAPGNSTTVDIIFDPTTGGVLNGTAETTGNDSVGGKDATSLTGRGTTKIVTVAPSTIGFTPVHIGSTGSSSNVTVSNTGAVTVLHVSSVSLSGTDFEFNGNGCTGQSCNNAGAGWDINPGGSGVDSEVFPVRCHPSAPAAQKSSTMTVTTDADSGTNTMTMTCNAIAPEINLLNTPVSFGDRLIGSSPQLTFTIQNISSGTFSEQLQYTYSLISGDTTRFSVSPTCTSTCTRNSGDTGVQGNTVTVTFTPLAHQSYSATLRIITNDPTGSENQIDVVLSGTGVAPIVTRINPTGSAIAFGDVDVGSASSPATEVRIKNDGDTPLAITSVSFSAGDTTQFQFTSTNQTGHNVAAGAEDFWTITCNPTTFGDKAATLTIASSNHANVNYSLTCTGRQALFTFNPTDPPGLNFGLVQAGTTSGAMTMTITNSGNKTAQVSSVTPSNGVFDATPEFTLPHDLAGGESMDVDVTFSPVDGTNFTTTFMTIVTTGTPASTQYDLRGDGRTAVEVSVFGDTDLDVGLGDLRVGVMTQRLVTVHNGDNTPFTLSAPGSNDLTQCTFQLVSPASLPASIPAGGDATFNVRVTPAAVGADTCVVTIGTNIPSTDTVNFSWNGVVPDVMLLAPDDGSLEYPGTDIDSAPVTQSVEVMNSGGFPLTIDSCAVTGDATFSLATSCAADIVVPAGGSTMIDVTYDPSVQAMNSGVLTLGVDAASTSTVQVQLTGVGVDQNIQLGALSYNLPPTYRNPDDDDVTSVAVEVTNPPNGATGLGAPLTISMALIDQTSTGVFELVDDGPFTVDAGDQQDLTVEFRPIAAPATFDGTLVIMNDTTGQEMAEVQLTGMGISRDVAVSPGDFDLQTTGVNVPVRLSDLTDGEGVVVSNMDSSESFVVRSLGFVDADGQPIESDTFRILDDGDPVTLAPLASEGFDVEFAPTESGDYEILLAVYLDNDPEIHSQVQLRGRAVDVELHGGGGCQTGRGGGWGAILLGAIGALGLRRRKPRARTVAILAGAAIVAVAAPASAQTRNIDITTFAPAPATEVDGFQVESPVIGVDGAWAIDLTFNHATNVLQVTSPEIDGMTDTPVAARSAVQLAFAYAFLDQFEAGLRVPFYQSSGDMPQFSGLRPADGSALGDVAGHFKARLFANDTISAAASLDVTVPTAKVANEDQFAGVDGPSGQVRALAGYRTNRFGGTGNVGFLARTGGSLADIQQGNAITFGAGGWFRVLDQLWVIGEGFGSSGMGSSGSGVQQLEAVLGVRYQVAGKIGISVGAGRGILTGIGSPDIRAFAMIDVAPRARPDAPLVIVRPPPPRDLADNDGDAIPNADDACKDDAEDMDAFKDDDVCIGPAPARESYLRIARIIAAAEITGADAIHPGYGFLAENAEFAETCVASNITFIGPTAAQIRVMGDKAAARKAMQDVGVPIVPGTPGPVEDGDEALAFARDIGFPVIIKAAAGGGGKGMRVAKSPDEFARSFSLARSEAMSAFGNDQVYVEKYLARPRHIEFQILGDQHGNILHLGERDCSIQRRHQKLIEEAPSPAVTPDLRERMGADAVRGAKAIDYVGAGTRSAPADPCPRG